MAHMTLPDRVGAAECGVDLEDAPGTRSFLFASTQHSTNRQPSAATPELEGIPGDAGFTTALPECVLDYTPLLRAQLLNLQRWVEEGIEPPVRPLRLVSCYLLLPRSRRGILALR